MMAWDLKDFVRESNQIEGIHRKPTQDEIDATEAFVALDTIEVENLEALVRVYAPGHVLRDRPGLDVRVGSYIAPRGGPEIRTELLGLLYQVRRPNSLSAWQAHVAYERLHPFTDGNGRSGRALWLWMMRKAPIGFLHAFYYQTLAHDPARS